MLYHCASEWLDNVLRVFVLVQLLPECLPPRDKTLESGRLGGTKADRLEGLQTGPDRSLPMRK